MKKIKDVVMDKKRVVFTKSKNGIFLSWLVLDEFNTKFIAVSSRLKECMKKTEHLINTEQV